MSATIRLARETDARPMLAIYEPVVRETAISFELKPPGEAEFGRRIRDTLEVTPWLACDGGGEIMGYAYAGRLRPREAYQWSVEVTVYVGTGFRRRGVGRALYTSLFACLRLQGYYNAFAAIALPNAASITLHETLGFEPIGVYRSVGYKLGSWHDSSWWQLGLQPKAPDPAPPRPLPDVLGTAEWTEAVGKGKDMLVGPASDTL